MSLTRRGRIVVFFVGLGVFLGAIALGGYLYLVSIGVYGSSSPGEEVTFQIPKGSGTEEIGRVLEENDIIKSAFGFRIAASMEGGVSDIQAGGYTLPTGLTAPDALRRLSELTPQSDPFVNVTFPEGSWITDIARILERKTHLSGEKFVEVLESGQVKSRYLPEGETNMEGLLFPSTYQVIERDDEKAVAQRLVRELEKRARQAGIDDVDQQGVTPYEAITIASMIEAEARHDEERPMIARVIYNRIAEGMTLGIDATVYYALGEHKPSLTAEDLEVESPYNTRKYPGIPPTPIGAPGEESLRAAVEPADGTWLYYVVSDCEGHHAFSTSYEEFLQNKAAYEALEC